MTFILFVPRVKHVTGSGGSEDNTRQHSSRMRTAHLPTVCVSLGDQVHGRGVAPQVNKFEQVSSDDHQISVAGEDSSQGGLPRSAV